METGFKRNLLAELLDSVGRGVLLMALGIGWFVFLWGLNLPALLAGIALGTLLLLLRRLRLLFLSFLRRRRLSEMRQPEMLPKSDSLLSLIFSYPFPP